MKTRKKESAEITFDDLEIEERKRELILQCRDFVSEFADCEGDVFYSTFSKASNAVWRYDESIKNSQCSKVGDEWSDGVCGKWRYPHLRGDD